MPRIICRLLWLWVRLLSFPSYDGHYLLNWNVFQVCQERHICWWVRSDRCPPPEVLQFFLALKDKKYNEMGHQRRPRTEARCRMQWEEFLARLSAAMPGWNLSGLRPRSSAKRLCHKILLLVNWLASQATPQLAACPCSLLEVDAASAANGSEAGSLRKRTGRGAAWLSNAWTVVILCWKSNCTALFSRRRLSPLLRWRYSDRKHRDAVARTPLPVVRRLDKGSRWGSFASSRISGCGLWSGQVTKSPVWWRVWAGTVIIVRWVLLFPLPASTHPGVLRTT